MSRGQPLGIEENYIKFLRSQNKLTCSLGANKSGANCQATFQDLDTKIRDHILTEHKELTEKKNVEFLIKEIRRYGAAVSSTPKLSESPASPEVASVIAEKPESPFREQSPWPPKRTKSPIAFLQNNRPRSVSPQRSRARTHHPASQDPDFRRATQPAGKLWNPATSTQPAQKSQQKDRHGAPRHQRQAQHDPEVALSTAEEEPATLMKQPETRPISQEQLVAEVKGIYAGLVMVEAKCIEVDNAQSSQSDAKLNNEQWQALIALHRTLLHEHHDFFLASQHPSATPALRRLASKYAMPARMWRHGIHSFLELLRHRLPASLEHMLSFIYLSYSMMALLYETVPAFEDTWIECLGDLGRYRMAIEDDDIRDREIWTSVSRHWYSKASDKAPTTGRLYHHLAILARPNALQQLFYYTKSLCVPIPFASARESIMTLFEPILKANQPPRLIPIDAAFVKAHGILFSGRMSEEFQPSIEEFLGSLDAHISRTTRRWMQSGYFIGIANCCALLSYGKEDNAIVKAIHPPRQEESSDVAMSTTDSQEAATFGAPSERAIELANGTHEVVFKLANDPNSFNYVHVVLVFMFHLAHFPRAMGFVDQGFPWKLVAELLNTLLHSYRDYERIQDDHFPRQDKEPLPRPLPEDFAMKGLLWVDKYFPQDWFSNDKIDEDEKYFEVASMTEERKERILWLGCRIASLGDWLAYDDQKHKFSVAEDKTSDPMDLS